MTFQQMLIKRNFNYNDCMQWYNGTLDLHTSTCISLVYLKLIKSGILSKSGLEQGHRWFVTDELKFRIVIIIIIIIIIINLMQTG